MSIDAMQPRLDLPIEQPTAFGFLSALLPARDLTGEAEGFVPRQTAFISRDHQTYQSTEPLFDRITRILHRSRSRHLVLLGRKGVGKTAVVQELARLAVEGDSFLSEKKLPVTPTDSRCSSPA